MAETVPPDRMAVKPVADRSRPHQIWGFEGLPDTVYWIFDLTAPDAAPSMRETASVAEGGEPVAKKKAAKKKKK